MPLAPGTPVRERAPGSFSAYPPSLPQNISQRPQLRKVDSSDSDDDTPEVSVNTRAQNAQAQQRLNLAPNPHANSSSASLQNFSRPSAVHIRSAFDSRSASPSTLTPQSSHGDLKSHTRKHSNSAGVFHTNVPATASINPNFNIGGSMAGPTSNLSASQIAAQAAMQHQSQHSRQRSQTLPVENNLGGPRRPSRGPTSPPMLSLTEASGERSSGFGNVGPQEYRNGLLGGGTSAATAAANVVFPRSPQSSPGLPTSEFKPSFPAPEKKTKVKLFSRPGKISINKESKDRGMSSPNKPYALNSLQRANLSTVSLAESSMSGSSSMYSMANSSAVTIKASDTPAEKDREKKHHHFLSRQKHKLSSKDDHHLPLSSAASNSRPADPNAPSSLYSFDLPPSPGPTSTSFAKTMSGLDLRHGGRALREKKKEEKAAAGTQSNLRESEMTYTGNEFGPSSLGSAGGPSYLGPPSTTTASSLYADASDLTKYGLNNMTPDDAWPFLRAKLLIIFEGEDLRLPIEDFNRLVCTHLQRCIQKRAPNIIVEDLRDLLTTGFISLDQTLRRIPDDRLIPHLVEMWLFTFTSILPYMQAVFLPLDLEFAGHGPLMSEKTARDFWGALPVTSTSTQNANSHVPAGQMLEVRRIALTAYRDTVILPRFDTLKNIFSRLSLESINSNINQLNPDTLSSSPDSFGTGGRPGTAMSLDPSFGSYNSQTTTLLGGADSSGARSRAISNVSYGSDPSTTIPFPRLEPSYNNSSMPPPPSRPFTPSSTHPSLLGLGLSNTALNTPLATQSQREANAEDSKQVTEMVGRMLQCMSVLASVGAGGAGDEEAQGKMEELCRALKLNWLGRGRTGRNRRGFVAARVQRSDSGVTGNGSRL